MTTDAYKAAKQQGYTQGYTAGKRRRQRAIAEDRKRAIQNAFWQRAMLAALPFAMQQEGWVRGGKPITTVLDRVRLARNMAVGFQLDLIEAGHKVISWQGVRRDESHQRRNAKKSERVGGGIWIFRPIADWTAAQVFSYCTAQQVEHNPLYTQGMSRVGCMPCINCNKNELRQIAARFPEHPARIAEWERIVGMCSKRGFSTFKADAHAAKDRRIIFADLNIWTRIEWSKTSRGGKQFNLLDEVENDGAGGCSSSYGLCDQSTGDTT